MMKRLFLWCGLLLIAAMAVGQEYILDKVVAKVGNEYVLHSEIEERYSLFAERGPVPEEMRCQILEELLVTNLLVHTAKVDSVIVSEEEVERQLDERIENILNMMGDDIEQFESYYGMTITQAKELNRIDLRKKLNAERMQSQIVDGIKVTPAEVKAYFESIPKDSLPYFNSEVEIGEIVHKPVVNEMERQKAIDKLKRIQDSLAAGVAFEELARRYSEDEGSGKQGGYLGRTSRGSYVPEFEGAAYKLEAGEVSDIVETEFGFHIIRLENRWGTSIEASHILVRPDINEADLEKARQYLWDVRDLVLSDSLTFIEAVKEYSDEDVRSYSNGGRVVNPKTGNTFFETGELEPDVFFAIDTMEIGEISGPIAFRSETGDIVYKIVQLQSRTPPHQASLQRDYSKILAAARQSKRSGAFNEWVNEHIGSTYILLDERFQHKCPNLNRWNTEAIGP